MQLEEVQTVWKPKTELWEDGTRDG